jgi:hypothetical protein
LIAANVNVPIAPDKLWHRYCRQHDAATVVVACCDPNTRAGIAAVREKADDGRSRIEPDQADAQRQNFPERRVMAVVQLSARQHFADYCVGRAQFQLVGQARGTKFARRILYRSASDTAL